MNKKVIRFTKNLTFQTMPFVVMYFASLLLMGLGIWVAGRLDWVQFSEKTFWFTLSTTAVASALTFFARFLQKSLTKKTPKYKTITEIINGEALVREEEIDTDFTLNEKIIAAFAKDDNDDFEEFIALENRERKIDEWKNEIEFQIDLHETKAKKKDVKAWNEMIDKNGKTTNKWILKKRKLAEMKTDEWIQKNIDFQRIDYDEISRSLITNGCLIPKNKKRKSRKDYITRFKGRKVIADVLPHYLLTIAATIMYALFVLEAVAGSVENWMTFAMKLLVLSMNFARGDDYADIYHREVTMNDLQFRLEIIKKYKAWQKTKPVKYVNGRVSNVATA